MVRRALAWSLGASCIVALPGVAAACPFCASAQQGSGGVSALVMGMMVLPFLLSGMILRAVLRTRGDFAGRPRPSVPSLEER